MKLNDYQLAVENGKEADTGSKHGHEQGEWV